MKNQKQQFKAWGIMLTLLALAFGASEVFGQTQEVKRYEAFSETCKREQKAFTRVTENITIKNGKRVVLAFERALIVHSDDGREIVLAVFRHGKKIRKAYQMKTGETWVQHDYDCREHRATVTIKEVDGP